MAEPPFWRRKTLAEMSHDEWESLCDGCGKCCLHKFEDEETGEIVYTDVACRLLDLKRCRCTRYRRRHELVARCARLGPDRLDELRAMPSTCAYRLLHEGKDLPWWHPLVSGDRHTVHKAAASVRYRVLAEHEVDEDELEQRLVSWPA